MDAGATFDLALPLPRAVRDDFNAMVLLVAVALGILVEVEARGLK